MRKGISKNYLSPLSEEYGGNIPLNCQYDEQKPKPRPIPKLKAKKITNSDTKFPLGNKDSLEITGKEESLRLLHNLLTDNMSYEHNSQTHLTHHFHHNISNELISTQNTLPFFKKQLDSMISYQSPCNEETIADSLDKRLSLGSNGKNSDDILLSKNDEELIHKFIEFLKEKAQKRKEKRVNISDELAKIPTKNDFKNLEPYKQKALINSRTAQIVKAIAKRIDYIKKTREEKFENKMKIFNPLPSFITISSFLKEMNMLNTNKSSFANLTPRNSILKENRNEFKSWNINEKQEDYNVDKMGLINANKSFDNLDDNIKISSLIAKSKKALNSKTKNYGLENKLIRELDELLKHEIDMENIMHDDNAESRFYDNLIYDLINERYTKMDIPVQKVDFDTQKMNDELEKIVNKTGEVIEDKDGVEKTAAYYDEYRRKAEKITKILRKEANRIINRDAFGLSVGEARMRKILKKRVNSSNKRLNSSDAITLIKCAPISKLLQSDAIGLSKQGSFSARDQQNLILKKDNINSRKSSLILPVPGSFLTDTVIKKEAPIPKKEKDQPLCLPKIDMKSSNVLKIPKQNNENDKMIELVSIDNHSIDFDSDHIQHNHKSSRKNYMIKSVVNRPLSTESRDYDTPIPSLDMTKSNIKSMKNFNKKKEIIMPELNILKAKVLNEVITTIDAHQNLEEDQDIHEIKNTNNTHHIMDDYCTKENTIMIDLQDSSILSNTNCGQDLLLDHNSKFTRKSKFISIDNSIDLSHHKDIFKSPSSKKLCKKHQNHDKNTKILLNKQPIINNDCHKRDLSTKALDDVKNRIDNFIHKIDDTKVTRNQFKKNLLKQMNDMENDYMKGIDDGMPPPKDLDYLDVQSNSKFKQNWKNKRQYTKKMLSVFLSN